MYILKWTRSVLESLKKRRGFNILVLELSEIWFKSPLKVIFLVRNGKYLHFVNYVYASDSAFCWYKKQKKVYHFWTEFWHFGHSGSLRSAKLCNSLQNAKRPEAIPCISALKSNKAIIWRTGHLHESIHLFGNDIPGH